ncbi:pyroglutamyl peptidase [Streptomyces sp. NPDC052396]|uniref:pyroglutamyl peptidase n=1 Tax=Streptomyces sp. NPDC052396 TaxID=3365689 RepID=UPI0037D7A28D
MRIIMRTPGLRGAVLAAAVLMLSPLAAPAQAAPRTPSLTVEEQRLSGRVPQEILRRSGFDRVGAEFARALAGTHSLTRADRLATEQGRRLWRRAVDRVQGRGPANGDLSRDDDRPLYWARLDLTAQLRRWQPEFALDERQRSALVQRVERASRGQDSLAFPAGHRVKRILVTGFDPFQLDDDIRRSNPSGAAALALDGTTVNTPSGPARIETALFPVRWDDFAAGTVEHTLLPCFRPGPLGAPPGGSRGKVDMFTTISQGRPGRFDVERTNGAWRGGFDDNARVSREGTVPVPPRVPSVHPQPQWTVTTLPYAAITAARTGPFPVYDHTAVTEIPAGGTDPVNRPDGPTPGSTARAGGGGDYLSNEIAYRATLLRDAVRARVPGGHLHTPVLDFGADNTSPDGAVTDPEFIRNRVTIVSQVRAVLTVAAGTLGR